MRLQRARARPWSTGTPSPSPHPRRYSAGTARTRQILATAWGRSCAGHIGSGSSGSFRVGPDQSQYHHGTPSHRFSATDCTSPGLSASPTGSGGSACTNGFLILTTPPPRAATTMPASMRAAINASVCWRTVAVASAVTTRNRDRPAGGGVDAESDVSTYLSRFDHRL